MSSRLASIGTTACAWAVTMLLPVTLARSAGMLWAGPDPDRARRVVMPGTAAALDLRRPLEGPEMRCMPNGDVWSACLMKDLYYDFEEQVFLFYGRSQGYDGDSDDDLHMRFDKDMCGAPWPRCAARARAPSAYERNTIRCFASNACCAAREGAHVPTEAIADGPGAAALTCKSGQATVHCEVAACISRGFLTSGADAADLQ